MAQLIRSAEASWANDMRWVQIGMDCCAEPVKCVGGGQCRGDKVVACAMRYAGPKEAFKLLHCEAQGRLATLGSNADPAGVCALRLGMVAANGKPSQKFLNIVKCADGDMGNDFRFQVPGPAFPYVRRSR